MGFLLDGLIVAAAYCIGGALASPAGFLGAFFAPLYCAGIVRRGSVRVAVFVPAGGECVPSTGQPGGGV